VSYLKRFFSQRKSRATSRKSESQMETLRATGHPQRIDNNVDHHRHGAEGHAFQVNNDPQQADEQSPNHRHGAEGHAFQVNNDPQQEDG